jgi:hypothetical protein
MPFIKTTLEGKKEIQVRAILAVAFAGAIIAGFFCKLLNPDQFMGIATMAISWYFAKGTISDSKVTPKPPTP